MTSRAGPLSSIAGFAVATIALLLTLGVALVQLDAISDAEADVDAALEALVHLDELVDELVQAEAGLRGHLLTGDLDYLQPYYAGVSTVPRQSMRVREAMRPIDDGGATEAFLAAAAKRMELMDELLHTFRDEGGDAALAALEQGKDAGSVEGKGVRDGYRTAAARVRAWEERAREEAAAARSSTVRLVGAGALFGLLSFVLAFLVAWRQSATVRDARREAEEVNALLTRAEELALRLNAANDLSSLLGVVAKGGRQLLDTEAFVVVAGEGSEGLAVSTSVRAAALRRWDPRTEPVPWLAGLQVDDGPRIHGAHSPVPQPLSGPTSIDHAVAVALSHRGAEPGMLVAISPLRPLRPSHLVALSNLAQTVSVALDNVRLVEDLRAESQRREEFMALLGHELRNPLNAIAGAAQLLERTHDGDDAQGRMVGIVARQSRMMRLLVDDLLDVERVRLGKLELRVEPCELGQLVQQVVADFEQARREVTYRVELRGVPVWVSVDPTRLQQALSNLLDNAAKFSPEGSTVEVTLDLRGVDAVIRVTDQGPGFDDEELASVFERFEQGRNPRAGGLGLGLTLVSGIVELHGGEVAARNAEGAGAQLEIRLPAGQTPGELPVGHELLPDIRVVVIDDRDDARRVMQGMVVEGGAEAVGSAADGAEGLRLVREVAPDLVLCDLGLGGAMDGYEVARRLRADDATRGIAAIAVTGYTTPTARNASLDAGFDAHVSKPVDRDQLLRTAARVLRQRRAAS